MLVRPCPLTLTALTMNLTARTALLAWRALVAGAKLLPYVVLGGLRAKLPLSGRWVDKLRASAGSRDPAYRRQRPW